MMRSDSMTQTPSIPLPSIFNDILGPVMRGPSSSHCAAALRIGRLARDFMDGAIQSVRVQYHPQGALATTHASQGSDMGLWGGLLGWESTDARLPDSACYLADAGIAREIVIALLDETHPSAYHLTLNGPRGRHVLVAVSTGGGMVELRAIDGTAVSIAGDYHETLIRFEGEDVLSKLQTVTDVEFLLTPGTGWIEIKSRAPLSDALLRELAALPGVKAIHRLDPVLPVLSRRMMSAPFLSASDMLNGDRGVRPLGELAVEYESARGGLSSEEVLKRMGDLVRVWDRSVAQGLEGTDYEDRILGQQSDAFQSAMSQGRLLDSGMLNLMTLYVTALMEMKSAMGVIVAAPTAGSCGALPGAVLAAAEKMGFSVPEKAKALLAGGLIGVFIAARSTFSAEIGGCQAECGAASGMAAAALATLAGAPARVAVNAASMALQNVFGMTCDPVANRVEVPCLGKNVMAAANALSAANLALAGFDPVIPLDEVIDAMDAVGRSLPQALRCTALGGLSICPTSKVIEERLSKKSR